MHMEEYLGPLVAVGIIIIVIVAFAYKKYCLRALYSRMEKMVLELSTQVRLQFMIQPCFRCHEFMMKLLEISPKEPLI